MSYKDFLLENYIWIIAVIIIIVVGVIGFLVDSKNKKKAKNKQQEEASSNQTIPEPLNTNINNNGMALNSANSLETNLGVMPAMEPLNPMPTSEVIQPINNVMEQPMVQNNPIPQMETPVPTVEPLNAMPTPEVIQPTNNIM